MGELELEPLEGFKENYAEWSDLAERAGNIFSTPEWAATWWRYFGRGRPLLLTGCRRSTGSLAGVLPLYLSSSRPFRVVRFLGHEISDQLGPVCAPADRAAVAEALCRMTLRPNPGWELMLAERMSRRDGWSTRLPSTVMRREASPSLRTEGITWESFLAARSANLRQQLRRRERRLRAEHGLTFRLVDDPKSLSTDLDELFRLHFARWSPEGMNAFAGPSGTFHRAFAPLALERGWLRLWFAEVGGQAVAAWYGFRFADTEWYYQAGRDPAWDSTSVAFVLLAWTIRQAIEDGMREYKLLLGDEPYKARFSSEDAGVETLAIPTGPIGRVAIAGARRLGARPAGRRLRERLARSAERSSRQAADERT